MDGEGVRVIAEGGFDHLREAAERHLAQKGHREDDVLAVVNRLEECSASSEGSGLPSALDCFIRRFRELGIPVEIDIVLPEQVLQ
ncbi:MAG: hypothetical protein WC242_01805 [Candidatus Paceibacterota bacterium]|jgi:hypothetical protein